MIATALLAELGRAQLLHEVADIEADYAFKHAMTHETAYGSLLRRRRAEVHGIVARTIEELYPDQLDENAALLARHFSEAGNDVAALEYARRAGDAAARVHAHTEAAEHYCNAVRLALRSGASTELLLALYLSCGRSHELGGHFNEALSHYEAMAAEARRRSDAPLELAALIACAGIRSTPNPARDPVQGLALSESALALARELGDRAAESRALWILMLLNSFSGHPRPAIAFGEQALVIARELGSTEQVAFILNGLFMAYWPTGHVNEAQAALAEAQLLWRGLDNLPMLAENLSRTSLIRYMAGEFDGAIEASDEAYNITKRIGHVWGQALSRAMVGEAYFDQGRPALAMAVMEEAVALGEQCGHPVALIATRADLAWVYGSLGDLEGGLELARRSALSAQERYPLLEPWPLAVMTRLHVRRGDLAAAEATVQAARDRLQPEGNFHAPVWVGVAEAELALAEGDSVRAMSVSSDLLDYLLRARMRPFIPDALYLKALGLLAQARGEEAWEALTTARAEADSMGSRRILWQIIVSLANIETSRGNRSVVAALRREASEIVRSIAAQIVPPALQNGFLDSPAVRLLLQAELPGRNSSAKKRKLPRSATVQEQKNIV